MAFALLLPHPFRHLWALSLSISLSMKPTQPPKCEAKIKREKIDARPNPLLFRLPDDIKYPLNTFLEALLCLCRASNDLK